MQTSQEKISFDFDHMVWSGITVEQVKLWETLYPDCDVVHEITIEMIRWIDKRKGTKVTRKKDWKRFICNWLKTAQTRSVL
jgi:hypothetical protein